MRIILSRKGFDSSTGGIPSPIFPDGEMFSIPITGIGEKKSYAEINKGDVAKGRSLADVLEQLSNGSCQRGDLTHFDPDLSHGSLPRLESWRPGYGQGGSALGHLESQGVSVGDVFVFFGWFKRVVLHGASWKYLKQAPDLHVIFGWLQVGEILPVTAANRQRLLNERPWLEDHPHMNVPPEWALGGNVIYLATDSLVLPGCTQTKLSGAAELQTFSPKRALTAPGSSRSQWIVPSWFAASDQRSPLSFHSNADRWTTQNGETRLNTVGRGQEFVLDCTNRLEATAWLLDVLS